MLIYSTGKSQAGNISNENSQMGNWTTNPRYIKSPSFDVSEIDGTHLFIFCGFTGNRKIDESEVSRGHSSQSASVMAGAGRRTEHFSRGRLFQSGQSALKGETALE